MIKRLMQFINLARKWRVERTFQNGLFRPRLHRMSIAIWRVRCDVSRI